MTIRTVEIDFEYMNYVDAPPRQAKDLYSQACSNDGVTINTWKKTWLSQIKANREKYGSFSEKSIGKLYNSKKLQPAILMGSGPSLKNNIHLLKDVKDIVKISCLHNFHYCEDHDVHVDYYVSLDAGEITLNEMAIGGKKTLEEYLEATRNKTLLCYIGSHPKLLESWRGEILFFSCPTPDPQLDAEIREIDPFYVFVSSGGNVLGACTYIAKAVLGCNPLAFVGADFGFSYTKKFHPWDDPNYKEVGHALRAMDVYGNKVLTWQSYYNFKCWFDWLTMTVPGLWINCTEGGLFGAYPEGNIRSIQQMHLQDFLNMYSLNNVLESQFLNPTTPSKLVLF